MADAAAAATTETTAATTAAATAAATTAAATWHDGINAELLGVAQNKGWKLDDPKEAFAAATNAYREAQKFIGVPETELLRMPKASAPPADLDAFWQRLGAAKEAKEIDLSVVKSAAGQPIDEKLADAIRTTAIAARAPKDVTLALAAAVQKHIDGIEAETSTVLAGKVAAEKAQLEKSWGPNKEAFEFVAKTTLAKLAAAAQLPPEKALQAWDALTKVGGIGAASAMEMLRVIGSRMGEDKFIMNGGGGGNAPLTREGAQARLTELKADKGFTERYLNGDVRAKEEMAGLHAIIAGTQRAA